MLENTKESSSALANELRNVVNQAEALLNAIGQDKDEALDALRGRVYESLDTAKARLADIEGQASRAARRAAVTAESWVRDNPWTAVAIGASIGLVLGALITSRSGSTSDNYEDDDSNV